MPKVSIITPTLNRQHFLPAVWECVRNQTHPEIEWLISDGSATPVAALAAVTDPKIRYLHQPQSLTIGARRNELCRIATGDVIVQFDDDDHYAPSYVTHMLSFMASRNVDFAKLFGFYVFARISNAFAYYDLEYDLPVHFVLQPNAAQVGTGRYASPPDLEWGFGFSYVFARRVWEAVPFPDRNHGEDIEFANGVRQRFKSAGMQDDSGMCLHVIHQNNSTIVFPQKLLRASKMAEIFPGFA